VAGDHASHEATAQDPERTIRRNSPAVFGHWTGKRGSRGRSASPKISTLWLASVLQKSGSNRLLLVPLRADPGLGALASAIAAALGDTLGLRVLVVNCDPDLHVHIDGSNDESLSKLTADFRAGLRDLAVPNLIPATSQLELKGAHPFADFQAALDKLSAGVDVILCVGGPLLEGPESVALARLIPSVIVSADAGKTSNADLDRVLELSQRESFTIVGSTFRQTRRYIPRWVERLFGWQ